MKKRKPIIIPGDSELTIRDLEEIKKQTGRDVIIDGDKKDKKK